MQKTTQTGRITSIEPMGTWSNGQQTFNKFKVGFANGDILSFLAKGEFKKEIGENITYEKNPQYGTGKVIYDKPQGQNYSASKSSGSKEDTQTYIIRQSMIKAAIDYHALQSVQPSENDVVNTARNFVTFINNG